MIDIIKIPPLQKLCITIGQLPASYLASMSFEEQVLWLCNYLEKTVIPAIDNNAEALKEVQDLFDMLKNYVDNYFDNLDVQDEINNKLDEMSESGELQEIIETFLNLNAVFGYDSVNDLRSATNLVVGSKAKTYGYNYANDGAGADYVIVSETTPIRLNNGLYAKKITDDCEFIFPGRWGSDNPSGNSNIVKVGEKVILFDTNSAQVYSYLKLMFAENNISHIDYMVVTHFDSDHRANLPNLINDGFLDNNSKYIHPECIVSIYGQAVKNWCDNVETMCQQAGIESIIPTENQIISVTENFSMRFGNVDSLYALNNYTTPNEASMVIECKHNDFCSLMMGDALEKTEKHLVDTDFIQNSIGLYTIPHHAIESQCYAPFYELINPKFAVAQAQDKDYNINLFTTNQSSALLSEKGCSNYFSFYNDDNIHFIEKDGSIECTQGVPIVCSGHAYNNLNIFCDSVNYDTEKQNGTEEYPFKDLPQALGLIRDWNNQHITIKLKPGTYGTAYTGTTTYTKNRGNIYNRKNLILIEGTDVSNTFINNGIQINNCFNVVVKKVTIRPDYNDHNCAYINGSKAYFVDCKFEGSDTTPYVGDGIKTANASDIICSNCEFKYLAGAYVIVGGSKLKTNADKISYLTKFIRSESNTDIEIGKYDSGSDFSTITDFDNYSGSIIVHSKPEKLTKSVTDVMLGDIKLPVTSNNLIYKYLAIHYSIKASQSIGKGIKIIPYSDITPLLVTDYNIRNTGVIDNCMLTATISGDTLTILRNAHARVNSDGTITHHEVETASDTTYGIQITSIDLI